MRVIKKNLPDGVKSTFGSIRGVKTKFINKNNFIITLIY